MASEPFQAIVDLVPMHHSDILRPGAKPYTGIFNTLLQRRRTCNRAAVGQLLSPRHPLGVILSFTGQTLARIDNTFDARTAAMKMSRCLRTEEGE